MEDTVGKPSTDWPGDGSEFIQKLKGHDAHSKALGASEPKIDYFLNCSLDTVQVAKSLCK